MDSFSDVSLQTGARKSMNFDECFAIVLNFYGMETFKSFPVEGVR